LRKEQTTS